MSRLDRLVSLLDTGYSSYIRNVAAEQIADVQKSRPEELFHLLGRVTPFLQSPKWDTRIATAKAIGLIAENTEWDPDAPLVSQDPVSQDGNTSSATAGTDAAADADATDSKSIKQEVGDDLPQLEDDSANLLSFEQLDINTVIVKGTPLLGSAGREYDQALQAMDSEHRLKMQRQTLKKKIGMDFLGDDDTKDLLDVGFDTPFKSPTPPPLSSTDTKERTAIKVEVKNEEDDPSSSPKEPTGKEPVNARLRALAKRKARFGGSPAPPSKSRIVESDKKTEKTAPNQDKVVVEHRDKTAELEEPVAVRDPRIFPFEALCCRLMFDMFEPTWEVRHGALLCIREIVRVHGRKAGMIKGLSKEINQRRNAAWLEDLACRLCCVFALDRFADYVADQAVAPVRESCAQTLSALILDVPEQVARSTFNVLDTLIMDPEHTGVWAACHGGMLGLRYFVTLRLELIVEDSQLFGRLVKCVLKGLNGKDDEVQAIAAAVLLPIATEFIDRRPVEEIAELLKILWECISDLKDELSTSVGNVMDLLATLCTYPKVLDVIMRTDNENSLSHLIPRLYPFLRHSIIDVRKAVLRSLKTFLTLEHGSKDWVSLVTLRLVFQNILLEQNNGVVELSMELWELLMKFYENSGSKGDSTNFAPIFVKFWNVAFPLLMTPIGSARRFYHMDDRLLIKPSGETYADAAPASASSNSKIDVNIDGPMISGDTLIVELPLFLRAKVNGSIALGRAVALAAVQSKEIPNNVVEDFKSIFSSTFSTQLVVVGILLEEFGKNLPDSFEPLQAFTAIMNPLLIKAMDAQKPVVLWRDINPILRAVRTQCQSLFTLLMSQNELPASVLPSLPTAIEGDPGAPQGEVFTLAQSRKLATKTFYELRDSLSPETQVRMQELLEDGRKNLVSSIEEAESSLESRNTSVRSVSAAAYINLNHGSLPAKLNPIIRGLMDEIKVEAIPLLHDRASAVLAYLVSELIKTGRGAAGSKIVKNLCGFLCVDVHEAPEFDYSEEDCILSLKKDDIKMDSKNVAEMLLKERENRVAFIKRHGAVLTLSKLCKSFGPSLFETLPEIKTQMFNTITNEKGVLSNGKNGQAIIDNMAVLRTLLPFLDEALWPSVIDSLPHISVALFSKFPVVRHVAARCIATICKVIPSAGITFVVKEILGKSLTDSSTIRRQGSIEALFHIMLTMGEDVLPYIVFFIVPVLGRMSDSNNDIRLISATTFASIIKLVPLESGIQDPDDIPVELLAGKEREREFIGQMMDPSRIQEFTLPIAVNVQLRRYQQEGINWLAFLNRYHLHGILCDDMGLGKTLQTICMVASDHVMRAEEHKRSKSEDSRRLPSLIICPTTLTGHWIEEFNRYVPSLKVEALVGLPKVRQAILDSGSLHKADIVITSYDTARNEVSRLAGEYEWNYCVLDEGHIIKNAGSKLAKAVKRYKATHRLVLTGTPIQNNVLELWSLFEFLMPGFLGSEKTFNERFSKPISARSSGKASPKDQEAATLAMEALHKQVLPFTLRRLKEDVLDDLPPKIIQDYYCDLNEVQRSLYDKFTRQQKAVIQNDTTEEVSESAVTKVQGDQTKKHIFQALQYMRKLCNHPDFVKYTKDELVNKWPLNAEQSPKLMALQQLLRDCGIGAVESTVDGVPEAMSQHRALIFCQQREMLDLVEKSLLQSKMPSVSYIRMDGSTPGPTRQTMVRKFNDDPSIDVLLLTTHVGGLGLNLTGADTVIFVEHDWNPMNDLQAMDRAHRLGQKRVVNVYRLITRNTLEERIMGLQQFKLNVASSVINQQNKGLMSMGTDQILDLFSTSAEGDVPISSGQSAELNASQIDPSTGKLVDKKDGKDFASGLGDLWDESEYAEEYNVDKFIKSMKK